jgi:hypothetical protein
VRIDKVNPNVVFAGRRGLRVGQHTNDFAHRQPTSVVQAEVAVDLDSTRKHEPPQLSPGLVRQPLAQRRDQRGAAFAIRDVKNANAVFGHGKEIFIRRGSFRE